MEKGIGGNVSDKKCEKDEKIEYNNKVPHPRGKDSELPHAHHIHFQTERKRVVKMCPENQRFD